MANFQRDLQIGLIAQRETEQLLMQLGLVLDKEVEGRNSKWDIVAYYNKKKYTFEVKWDLMYPKTGNSVVEYESRGKPSGINVTTAKIWVYKFGSEFYAIPTSAIKKLIKRKKYHRDLVGGDFGSNTKMYLFKADVIKKEAVKIGQTRAIAEDLQFNDTHLS